MTVSRRPLRLLSNLVAAIAALVLAGTLDPIVAEAAGWGPLGRVSVAARSASSASKASVYQTQKNSRNYRRAKSKRASRDRAKIRRATRRSRYRRGHQPGGYCMYDTKGNVILKPDGVECDEPEGEYMAGRAGSAGPASRAARTPEQSGCSSGNCTNGRGVYVWSNGTHYSGGFRNGRQHGQGVLVLPDGSNYQGEWRDGKKHGQGTGTYSDGRVRRGLWQDNKYVGLVRARRMNIEWPDLSKPPPRAIGGGRKDVAVVVGVTQYAHVAEINGATENAANWYNYLVKSRGIPIDRVSLLLDEDATVEDMRWALSDAAERVERGGTLWFVFVGHGAPAKDGRDGLLVGFDAQQKARSIEARSLRRSELLAALQDSKAKHIQVFLDACFSGRSSDGRQLVAGLQPLVVTSLEQAQDPRVTLMTAAGGDEYAGPLPGADRPAFSYLALGGLRGWADRNEDGRITSGELHAYVTQAMRALVRDRRQRPSLVGKQDVRLVKSGRERGPDLATLVVGAARR
jgi:hypothetical protein